MSEKKTLPGGCDPDLLGIDFEGVLARLKSVFRVKTDTDLAKCLGLQQGSISKAKQKKSVPPSWITTVALTKGISADWLLTGDGEIKRGLKFKTAKLPNEAMMQNQETTKVDATRLRSLPFLAPLYNDRENLACHDCETVMLPVMEARLSALKGAWEISPDPGRSYSFRSDFLRLKGKIIAMILVRVAGDSMEPEIKNNDVVLIDTSKNTPQPGNLFAIAIEDLVYIKKLDAKPGKFIFTSANNDYIPLEIDARGDLLNGIQIIGKVVWLARDLD
jgi:phage repressor protein C with HTH and peptisase S24 domain